MKEEIRSGMLRKLLVMGLFKDNSIPPCPNLRLNGQTPHIPPFSQVKQEENRRKEFRRPATAYARRILQPASHKGTTDSLQSIHPSIHPLD